MLDHAFRLTLKNFTTYFLIVACVTVPLHIGYAFVFQKVIAVSEIHDEIKEFPSERQVRSVGTAELRDARLAMSIVTGLEILLLPVLARASRRVLLDDAEGELVTVKGAWAGLGGTGGSLTAAWSRHALALLVALATALALGFLAERVGILLAEPLSDQRAWAGVGLAQAAARALAAPFFLVPWAVAAGPLRLKMEAETPKL
jgi:hypothetical protein